MPSLNMAALATSKAVDYGRGVGTPLAAPRAHHTPLTAAQPQPPIRLIVSPPPPPPQPQQQPPAKSAHSSSGTATTAASVSATAQITSKTPVRRPATAAITTAVSSGSGSSIVPRKATLVSAPFFSTHSGFHSHSHSHSNGGTGNHANGSDSGARSSAHGGGAMAMAQRPSSAPPADSSLKIRRSRLMAQQQHASAATSLQHSIRFGAGTLASLGGLGGLGASGLIGGGTMDSHAQSHMDSVLASSQRIAAALALGGGGAVSANNAKTTETEEVEFHYEDDFDSDDEDEFLFEEGDLIDDDVDFLPATTATSSSLSSSFSASGGHGSYTGTAGTGGGIKAGSGHAQSLSPPPRAESSMRAATHRGYRPGEGEDDDYGD
jgi:hypothetical protein